MLRLYAQVVSAAHLAFFYRDAGEYVDGVRSFLGPGLAAGDAAVAAVPPTRLPLLRDAFGDDVELLDMSRLGSNPGRIIPAVYDMLERHAGRRLHYVGEPIWAGRGPEEIREAMRHEALINLAWSDAPIRVLCPYDTAGLSAEVLADAERTHPHVAGGDGAEAPSAHYAGAAFPDGCDLPLPDPPAGAATVPFGAHGLGAAREAVLAATGACGLTRARASDLLLAVNELAANSLRHGGGSGVLRIWHAKGRLTCEISDAGRIGDPLAGRRPPGRESARGRGLWLVHQLCDLVEARTGADGTTVRVHAAL